VLFILVADCAD